MNPIVKDSEEDEDYDPFAQWRPGNLGLQEVSDLNMEEDGFDDFAEFRPSVNKKSETKQPTKKKDVAKDVAKQVGKEILIGVGGAYGDLADLFGLKTDNEQRNERSSREFQALERMEQPGYVPNYHDIETATGSLIEPQPFNFPTSEQVRRGVAELGGPGEAETIEGRYAGNAAKIFGQGLAFGLVNPFPAAVAGVTGEGVKDIGGGELAKAAAEIVALITTPGQLGRKLVGSASKKGQEIIKGLRDLGYTEEQITLAINSASKGKAFGSKARKSAKTEQAFEDFIETSDKMVSDILTKEIPGIEKGTKHIHEMASDMYGRVAKEAGNITIRDSTPFINSATSVVNQLRKNLGKNPEAEPFLKRIAEAVVDSTKNPTAESFMNFYKELNSMGNWMGRAQKDRLITEIKNGIKDTFKREGVEGQKFAKRFEEANRGIQKAYQAEEAHNILQKAVTQDGTDFKKMNKLFDNADNVESLQKALGIKQTENLQRISKAGSQIQNFDKAWKSTHLLQGSHLLDIVRGGAASYYIFKGDLEGLAGVLATKAGGVAVKKLAEKSLTDPRYQNIIIKGLHAIRDNSPRTFGKVQEELKRYLKDEKIDLEP